MRGDWVKLHRSVLEHPVFQHPGLWKLWSLCLLKANWKPGRMLIRGTMQTVEVPRGAFVTSRESLKGLMYPDRDRDGVKIRYEHTPPTAITIWRWLHALEAMGSVKLENVNNHCTLVSVCKYTTYQEAKEDSCSADDPPVINACSADDPPVIRIEERQERKEGKKGSDEPPSTATSTPPFDPSAIGFPEFPCAGGKKSQANTWRLSEALVSELAAAFPGVDVRAECRKAHVWVKANLERRKTASGMPAFLNRWISKAQNDGRGRVLPGSLPMRRDQEPTYPTLSPRPQKDGGK